MLTEIEKNVLLFVLAVGIIAYVTTFTLSFLISANAALMIYTFDTGWAVGSTMVFLYTKYSTTLSTAIRGVRRRANARI